MGYKPRFVFGILSVFYAKSKDGWGHQKGPVVFLPNSHSEALTYHEVFHVKQWYVTLGFMSLLMLIRFFRFRFEAAAYGESLRRGGGDVFGYAKALASKHYRLNKTPEECAVLIAKRKTDGRFF